MKAGGNIGLPEDYVFYFGNIVGDNDGDGQIGCGDYSTLVDQFGQSGSGLAADFNRDARTDLIDFAILRTAYGNSLSMLTVPDSPPSGIPRAPASLVPVAPAPTVSLSTISIIKKSPNGNSSGNFSIAPTASWAIIALLIESHNHYVSLSQPTRDDPVAPILYCAATIEEDLRTLGDNLPSDNSINDPLHDVLTEHIVLSQYPLAFCISEPARDDWA